MARERVVPLGRLARAVEAIASEADVSVTGIATDSRRVRPGDLFVCVRGLTVDGHDFAPAAAAAGAAALVVERPVAVGLPTVLVADVRRAAGPIAAEFFDHPSRDLIVIGVTGTNGKTTVTHLVAAAAAGGGMSATALGTLSGPRTTPEPVELQRTLAAARDDAGLEMVAMEVSSHALDQHRVDGTHFTVSVFTNLSPDHLDYHGDMARYEAAKARLFEPALSAAAVVNVDDPAGRRLAADLTIPCVEVSPSAATGVESSASSTSLRWRDGDLVVPLGGSFMVDDVLLAAEAAVCAGEDPADVRRGLAAAPAVRGRFEVVAGGDGGPMVIVDYAHTPDALERTLASARPETTGDLTVVFGCGGDRDRAKRPSMGEIATRLADRVVVTDDNPRSEDPAAIVEEILAGIPASRRARVVVEHDRRSAIALALGRAGTGDVVVVAGKGHETTQEYAGEIRAFDDRSVVRNLLAAAEDAR